MCLTKTGFEDRGDACPAHLTMGQMSKKKKQRMVGLDLFLLWHLFEPGSGALLLPRLSVLHYANHADPLIHSNSE